jgi:dienelactone hydrolase
MKNKSNWLVVTLFMIVLLTGCSSLQTIDKPVVNNQSIPIRLIVKSQETPAHTVLISHGSSCVLPGEYEWADRIFSWGFNAVIIDHCSLRGIGDHSNTNMYPINLRNEDRINDYRLVSSWLETQNFHKGKIGLIGFSRGGEGVIHFASTNYYVSEKDYSKDYNSGVDVAVAYYPVCKYFNVYALAGTPFPILFQHGKNDNVTELSDCQYEFWVKDKNLTEEIKFNIYEDSHHSFDRSGSSIEVNGKIFKKYNHQSAIKSYDETRKFLSKYLD